MLRSLLSVLQSLLVLLGQPVFQRLQLLAGDYRGAVRGRWYALIIPACPFAGGIGPIGPHQPVADVVQLLDHLQGVELADRAGIVDGLVADLLDHPCLLEDGLGQ